MIPAMLKFTRVAIKLSFRSAIALAPVHRTSQSVVTGTWLDRCLYAGQRHNYFQVNRVLCQTQNVDSILFVLTVAHRVAHWLSETPIRKWLLLMPTSMNDHSWLSFALLPFESHKTLVSPKCSTPVELPESSTCVLCFVIVANWRMKNLHFVWWTLKNTSRGSVVSVEIVIIGEGRQTIQRDARRGCRFVNADDVRDSIVRLDVVVIGDGREKIPRDARRGCGILNGRDLIVRLGLWP